jgi:predicted DNA-binding transcriptional regulator YafY
MRGDQLARQWRILMYLSNSMMGRRLQQIAEEVECSERIVRRDIEALQAAGFAIYPEKIGQSTVWKMSDAFRQSPPLPLTTMEIFALLLAETELRGSSDLISQSFSAVTDKILKSRPPAFREQMELLKERFYAGGEVQSKKQSRPQMAAQAIVDAIANNQKVAVTYRNASGERSTNRKLAPLHFWLVNGSRYVVAYCYENEQVRTFNLKRFLKVAVLEERFTNKWGFDMQKHAMETFGVFHARPERIDLWFDPMLESYIQDHPLHSSQVIKPGRDGLTVEIEVGINESLISRIMGFGSLARVLAPDRLAIVIMEKHRSAFEAYSKPVPGAGEVLPLEF